MRERVEAADIFIAVLWNRLGTRTANAESGTVEEYETAHARWARTGRLPRIMFYFRRSPAHLELDDLEQYAATLRFQQKLQGRSLTWSERVVDGPGLDGVVEQLAKRAFERLGALGGHDLLRDHGEIGRP